MVFWILSAKNVVDNSLISFQRGCSELVNIANAIKDTDEGYPVYFIYNENYSSENWHAERIQFMLPDKSFEKITYDQLEDLSGDYYVVHLWPIPLTPPSTPRLPMEMVSSCLFLLTVN